MHIHTPITTTLIETATVATVATATTVHASGVHTFYLVTYTVTRSTGIEWCDDSSSIIKTIKQIKQIQSKVETIIIKRSENGSKENVFLLLFTIMIPTITVIVTLIKLFLFLIQDTNLFPFWNKKKIMSRILILRNTMPLDLLSIHLTLIASCHPNMQPHSLCRLIP